jgi:hypothetical protein
MFKKADHDRIIQIAKEAIEREGKVHALAARRDWGDVSFMMEGQHIEQMAAARSLIISRFSTIC